MSDPRQEQLRRQLANDEPKCGNCGHWECDARIPVFGVCGAMFAKFKDLGAEMGASGPALELSNAMGLAFSATTDLDVCSKWEPIDYKSSKE